jgi:predicted amidohydrolase YtcJ
MLANKAALDLAGIDLDTENRWAARVVVENGKVTGVLVDNAMNLVEAVIPAPDRETARSRACSMLSRECFSLGLTSVSDAGLDREIIELIDSLQKAQSLKMRIYAMISASARKPGSLSVGRHVQDRQAERLVLQGLRRRSIGFQRCRFERILLRPGESFWSDGDPT